MKMPRGLLLDRINHHVSIANLINYCNSDIHLRYYIYTLTNLYTQIDE